MNFQILFEEYKRLSKNDLNKLIQHFEFINNNNKPKLL